MKDHEQIVHALRGLIHENRAGFHEVARAIRGDVHKKTIRLAITGLFIVAKSGQTKAPMPIKTSCKNNEKVVVTLAPVDSDNLLEKLDGDPVAKITAGSGTAVVVPAAVAGDIATVEIIPDDGFVGSLAAEIDADAALGDRVNIIIETVTIDVTAPVTVPKDAVSLGATVSVVPKIPVV